jgi:hypothetical protein
MTSDLSYLIVSENNTINAYLFKKSGKKYILTHTNKFNKFNKFNKLK